MTLASALLYAALAAAAPAPDGIQRVLESTPGDSLAAPLRRLEQQQGRSPEAGEVALTLARFHFARGEYRQAAETFARAAARLDPERKSEARYGQGLCELALQQAPEARATLEQVAASSPARRADALLGLSFAWERLGRPDRVLEALEQALASGPSEATPATLERIVAFAPGQGRGDLARRAADRLRREYPASVEAARLRLPAAAPSAGAGFTVQIGAFADAERARALATSARAAGFPGVRVIERGAPQARRFVVRLGAWESRAEAERAAARAAEALGVSAQIEGPR